jgi:branched-chain amino acid transport system permease protein
MLIQILNGLSFGFLLFLLGSGLSLMFGLAGIINLSHGSYFMLGAYVGYSVIKWTGNFWVAIFLGGGFMGLLGVLMECFLLRRLHLRYLDQVLLTFGFVWVFMDLSKWLWGGDPLSLREPGLFAGSITLWGDSFPIYRLTIIFIGSLIAVLLYLFQEKTLIGAIVRAGVEDREMVSGLGINIGLISTGVFSLGSFMAGFGGVIGGPILGAYQGMDWEILVLALVVVVVGGLGSLKGALLGSLLIGMVDNFGKALFPNFAMVTLFIAMAVILLLKPSGLLGKGDR